MSYFFLIDPFRLMVPKSYTSLYLASSISVLHMRCFYETSYSLMSFSIYSTRAGGFSFLSIYGQIYPIFQPPPWHTAFLCFCSLTFCGRHVSHLYTELQLHGMEYTQVLFILYSVIGFSEEICSKNRETPEYCLDILCANLLNIFGSAFNKR